MKRFIAGLAAGAVLATAGVASALGQHRAGNAYKINPGDSVTYAGLVCTAYSAASATAANVVCVRNNLAGYGVVVSQKTVVVARRVNGKVVVVFRHANN